MLTLLIALGAAVATPQDQVPPSRPIALPMNRREWDAMTPAERNRYARITVQALRRSPAFSRCQDLDPDLLEIRISELTEEGGPLMMGVAIAAYTMCDKVDR